MESEIDIQPQFEILNLLDNGNTTIEPSPFGTSDQQALAEEDDVRYTFPTPSTSYTLTPPLLYLRAVCP